MTASFVIRGKKSLQHFDRDFGCHIRSTETKNIGIIVQAGGLGFLYRADIGPAHITEAIRRQANSQSRLANQDSAVSPLLVDGPRHFIGKVGIIDRFRPVRPVVDDFVAGPLQGFHDRVFQLNSAVIGSDCNAV